MNEERALVSRYKRARLVGVILRDMDPSALAGYYLYTYHGDPVGALMLDINNLRVPSVNGRAAKIIILAALSRKNVVK